MEAHQGASLAAYYPNGHSTVLRRVQPQAVQQHFTASGTRSDGRLFADTLPGDVVADPLRSPSSSALVSVGATVVICGVSLQPIRRKRFQNPIIVNVDASALCSPHFRPGPPSSEVQANANRLRELVLRSIDWRRLTIQGGEATWAIHLNVACLNDEGHLLNASIKAAFKALSSTKIPHATYNRDDDTVIVQASSDHDLAPLSLCPEVGAAATQKSAVLLDPSRTEAVIADAMVSWTTSDRARSFHMVGIVPRDLVKQCMQRAV